MGGGAKAAPAPDYTPIAAANKEAAEISAQVSREQLAWAREQYARDRGVTDQILEQLLPTMQAESDAAAADRNRYNERIQPMEDQLIAEANAYDTPERREQEASRAQADVSTAFAARRKQTLENLASYGVDPSMARSGALDAAVGVQEAAVSATAANSSRLATEATGRALRGEVINLGRGYQNQIAGAYATGQNAGTSALSGNLATTASGAQTMGTGLGWANNQTQTLGNWGGNVTSMSNAARAQQTEMAKSKSSGIGALAGGVMGMAGTALGGPVGGMAAGALKGALFG